MFIRLNDADMEFHELMDNVHIATHFIQQARILRIRDDLSPQENKVVENCIKAEPEISKRWRNHMTANDMIERNPDGNAYQSYSSVYWLYRLAIRAWKTDPKQSS